MNVDPNMNMQVNNVQVNGVNFEPNTVNVNVNMNLGMGNETGPTNPS